MAGWAADPSGPTKTVEIRIRIDSSYYFPASNWRYADLFRSDLVANLPPQYGGYHGFNFQLPMPDGVHTVCAEIWSGGAWGQIDGCKTRTMNGSTTSGRWFGRLWQQHQYQNISVSYGRPTAWRNDIDVAAGRWNPGTTRINVNATTSTQRSVNVVRMDLAFISPTLGGRATFAGSCPQVTNPCLFIPRSGGPYTYNEIYLNTANTAMDGTTTAEINTRRDVIAHEFGRALGLGHNPNPGSPVIMYPIVGDPNFTGTPSSWDQESINKAYP